MVYRKLEKTSIQLSYNFQKVIFRGKMAHVKVIQCRLRILTIRVHIESRLASLEIYPDLPEMDRLL